MESWLQRLLSKLTFLNLGSSRLQAEFGSHLGFGFTVPLLAHFILGPKALIPALWIWGAYSVIKELFTDGHLKRIILGSEKPEEFKDFYTDLLSRLAPLATLAVINHWLGR